MAEILSPSPKARRSTSNRILPDLSRACVTSSVTDRCHLKNVSVAGGSIEEIFSRLEAGGGEFATKTRSVLGRMSPTSLKLTLRLLRAARDEQPARLSSCLSREFRAIQRAMAPPSDFFEGIRAALVDKDKSPSWSPARVAEVLARRN